MRLLLDTQILIILMTDRKQLSRREKLAITDADQLIVSAVSLMELRIKVRAERRRGLPASVPVPADAMTFCEAHAFDIHPFTADDATVQLAQEPPHGDPFDELLLTHAQALQAELLTRDKKLRRHPLAYRP